METYRLMDFIGKTWTSLGNAGDNLQPNKFWNQTILQSDHDHLIKITKDDINLYFAPIISKLREEIEELKADHKIATKKLLSHQHAEREKLMQESALCQQRLKKLIATSRDVIKAYKALNTKKGLFISSSRRDSKDHLYDAIHSLEGVVNNIT